MTCSSHTHTHIHSEREREHNLFLHQKGGSNYCNFGQWTVTVDLSFALLSEKKKEVTRYFRRNKACDDKRADDTHQWEAKSGN